MLTLYDDEVSGNCYKVRLLLAQLELPHRVVRQDVTVPFDERPEEFLARSPHGRVPQLVFEDGRSLSESNAILFHLAEGTAFLPEDPFLRAQCLQWMFFEQNNHEPAVAVAIAITRGVRQASEKTLAGRRAASHEVIGLMERHLAEHDWFVGDGYTVADISLYAYTHEAHEGEISLEPFPAVRAWLERVKGQPRHVPMEA